MKRVLVLAVSAGLALAAFSSCSNDPTLNGVAVTGSNLRFVQVDRVGEAGLREVFSAYARHDASMRATPVGDSGAMSSDINGFVTGSYAGRSQATSTFLQNLLTPDVLLADLSQSGDATYLGVETNGQIRDYCNGFTPTNGKFGGRALAEDVATTTFRLVWGNLVSTISAGSTVPNQSGAVADDGNEKDGRSGRPNLTSANVSCAGKHFSLAAFPYLGTPR